jgi:hypothetical protein
MLSSSPRRFARWLPFLGGLVFVGAVIACANGGAMQDFFRWVNRQPFGDKLGHFFLVGALAALLNYALRWRSLTTGPMRLQLGGLLIAGLITLEETSQLWIATRSFDLADLAANYAGILCAERLARQWRR